MLLVTVLHPDPGPPVVLVTGELDATNVMKLCETLFDLARADCDVVIDFGRVDFMDLLSARALADAARTIVCRGHALTLRRVPSAICRLLNMSGLSELFTIEAGPS